MSEPALTAVFNGVVSLLREADAGVRNFIIMASYLPRFDLAQLETRPEDVARYGVVIVPRGMEATAATRGHDQVDVSIDVGIVKVGVDGADCDAMEGAFTAIRRMNQICRTRLATDPPASWIGRRCDPIYDVEKLQRDKLFYSVTTQIYRVIAQEP